MGKTSSKQTFEQKYICGFKNPEPDLGPELQATNKATKCFHRECGRIKQRCENASDDQIRKRAKYYASPGYCRRCIDKMYKMIEDFHENETRHIETYERYVSEPKRSATFFKNSASFPNTNTTFQKRIAQYKNGDSFKFVYSYRNDDRREKARAEITPEYKDTNYWFHVKVWYSSYSYEYGYTMSNIREYCMCRTGKRN